MHCTPSRDAPYSPLTIYAGRLRKHSKYFSHPVNCFAKFNLNVKYVKLRAFSTSFILLNDKIKCFKLQVSSKYINFSQIKILLNKCIYSRRETVPEEEAWKCPSLFYFKRNIPIMNPTFCQRPGTQPGGSTMIMKPAHWPRTVYIHQGKKYASNQKPTAVQHSHICHRTHTALLPALAQPGSQASAGSVSSPALCKQSSSA